eukprot:scaffold404822_cov43-Prasinocladus_malaysianus.AAC.1
MAAGSWTAAARRSQLNVAERPAFGRWLSPGSAMHVSPARVDRKELSVPRSARSRDVIPSATGAAGGRQGRDKRQTIPALQLIRHRGATSTRRDAGNTVGLRKSTRRKFKLKREDHMQKCLNS